MPDEWLTYEQAGERLSVSPEAARQKAIRGRWPRTKGNDGKARVRLPDGWTNSVRTPAERTKRPVRTPSEPPNNHQTAERLVDALESHVETLKADLAAERGRAESALRDLENERTKASQAIADYMQLSERYLQLTEDLANERARTWWSRLVG